MVCRNVLCFYSLGFQALEFLFFRDAPESVVMKMNESVKSDKLNLRSRKRHRSAKDPRVRGNLCHRPFPPSGFSGGVKAIFMENPRSGFPGMHRWGGRWDRRLEKMGPRAPWTQRCHGHPWVPTPRPSAVAGGGPRWFQFSKPLRQPRKLFPRRRPPGRCPGSGQPLNAVALPSLGRCPGACISFPMAALLPEPLATCQS